VDGLDAYRHLSDAVFTHYAAGRQREAVALIAERGPALAPWRAELAHLEACCHGSVGEHDRALEALVDAHAAGAWWDPGILVDDDDLAGLRGRPAFEQLVASSRARWQEGNAHADRGGDRLALPEAPPRGLLVALHGAEEDADDAMAAWQAATTQGVAVLAVRSSQRTSPAYRSWPDATRAAAEVAGALAALPDDLRSLPTVAAGFSAGGRVALRWALQADPHPVAGVVAVAPAVSAGDLGEPDRTGRLRPALLVVGSEDDLADDVAAVAAALAPQGFALDTVPGLGHRVPDDLATRLAGALTALG
jgi:predicted esterase